MNYLKTLLLISVFVPGFLLLGVLPAYAITPTLSLSTNNQTGDNVQINITGDPNATGVNLFVGTQSIIPLSALNSSGTLSYVLGSAQSENQVATIAPNTMVYVKVGGINGVASNQVQWPYVQNSSATTGALTLSQTALLLNAGQTSTVTANLSSLYLQNNSNPSIANINFNAGQITVQAITYGSTTVNICAVGSTTTCATIAITVQNSGAQQLSFSQNNFSIVAGQSQSVLVSGGTGTYIISNNSNQAAVQASLNGSTVTLLAQNTTSGASNAASITICTTGLSICGIINVSSSTVNSSAISFSQTNPVVPISQSATVTIYGGILGSNFYVASNSNPSLVQANITGNILTLIANPSTGTTTINICAYGGTCGTLTANVSNTGMAGGALSLSQTSISILAGQSANITILGGSTPYTISSANSGNIFNSDINGSVLTIYGVNPGTSNASVCSSAGCTSLSITVNSVNSNSNTPSFSQNNILLNIGQQSTVNVSGAGTFYAANNSSAGVVSISMSGSQIILTGNSAGTTNISICQNNGGCATLYVTVNQPANIAPPVATLVPIATPAPVIAPAGYVFSRNLSFNSSGADVLVLQKYLVAQGFLTATPNGHYGPATVAAVKKLQKANGIKQLGNVGPSTRNFLNNLKISS